MPTQKLIKKEEAMLLWFTAAFVLVESVTYAVKSDSLLYLYALFLPPLVLFRARSQGLYVSSIFMLSVVMISEWSYVLGGEDIFTFSRLRIFGISLLSCLIILEFGCLFFKKISAHVLVILLYAIVVTLANTFASGIVLSELILRDVLTYTPLLMVYALSHKVHAPNVLRVAVRMTALQFAITFFLGNSFDYGTGSSYLILSAAGYLMLPAILIAPIKIAEKWLYGAAYAFLLASGLIFLGGKSYVVLILSMGFILYHFAGKNVASLLIAPLFCLIVVVPFGLGIVDVNVRSAATVDDLSAYKLDQLLMIMNPSELLSSHTSIGNIYGEGYTLLYGQDANFLNLLFGRGLGGGISDSFGVLEPWVGAGGYDELQLDADRFTRLHLSALNFWLKFGLISLVAFAVYFFRRRDCVQMSKLVLLASPMLLLVADSNIQSFTMCALLVLGCLKFSDKESEYADSAGSAAAGEVSQANS